MMRWMLGKRSPLLPSTLLMIQQLKRVRLVTHYPSQVVMLDIGRGQEWDQGRSRSVGT